MKAARKAFALLVAVVPLTAFAQVDVPPPPNQLPATDAPAAVDQEGMETLTRGPIHEAFANPADADPKPTPVVPDKPPPDVPEEPPTYQPEGDFIWIPGYFEWDEDRPGFIWVTGVWRQPPPGKRWLPGYWQEVDGGWQRVHGFWIDDEVEQVSYQPAPPPATLEVGPSSPQPADNFFWIPGNWNYANTNYVWQAGYWAPYQPNWVWVQARWMWTPAGYVFLPGHWDYRLANRGQIFAPVYFSSAIYTRPGWFYRPAVVIPTSNLFIHLWLRPTFGCYYFGNYYGQQYAGLGFVPWANIGVYQRQRFVYDPFYSYAAVHYRRQGVDFIGRVQGWHDYYVQHPGDRMPVTWREQQKWIASHPASSPALKTQLTASHITEVARQTDAPLKLKKIDEKTLQAQVEHAKELRNVDNIRKNLEREHAHVHTRLPTVDGTPRNLDQTKLGTLDPSKTGPLVDRIDKKGKGGTDDDGKKGDTAKGDTVKLNLPKIKLPSNVSSNIGAATGANPNIPGNVTGIVPRNAAPPLPLATSANATSANNAAKGKTIAPRTNVLPGANNISPRNTGRGNSAAGNVTGNTITGNSNIGNANEATTRGGKAISNATGNAGKATGNAGKTTGKLDGVPRSGKLPSGINELPGGANRAGKTTGNTGIVPRSGTLPPTINELPGNTNRGGQGNARTFQPPGNDSKGGGNTAKAGNDNPPGGKGKKRDNN